MELSLFYAHPWLFPTFAAITGLLVGSFLNVVIHRLPVMMENEWKKEFAEAFPQYKIKLSKQTFNLSVPRSTCPKCHTQIRAIDNIPVISWLILGGKCHSCANPISIRYPLIELLTALLSLSVALKFGMTPYALAAIVFVWVLVAATFIDLDTMLLPDSLTLPLLWGGIGMALLEYSPVSLTDSVVGAMIGYLSLWSIYWLFKLLTKKEGMGYGDFKLLAAFGAWFGWQSLPLIVLLSSVVGLIFGLIQLHLQKKGIDRGFPFGPSLAGAAIVYLFWGTTITHWYLTNYLGL